MRVAPIVAVLTLLAPAPATIACSASGDRGPPGPDGGAPFLVALRVSSSAPSGGSPDASTPVELTPPFSPDIHDYYVRCAAGENLLSVSITAAPGDEGSLLRPMATAPSSQQTLSLLVDENQAVVAAASRGAATVAYWVRCLPHDFPPFEWSPHAEGGAPTPGYYLLGVARPPHDGSGAYAFMLDNHGVPVWYLDVPGAKGAVFDVDSILAGAVSYMPIPTDVFAVRQFVPPVTREAGAEGVVVTEHDLRYWNGHFYGISSPVQAGVDLTGLRAMLTDGGAETLSGPQKISSCNLVEFAPDGSVVWTWKGTDHVDPARETTWPREISAGIYDVMHCNSIDVDPESGDLLLSARQTNALFYIDRETKRVLWKMGGRPYSKDGAALVRVADPFVCQHDARLLGWSQTRGRGQVTLFDDETDTSSVARGVVYDVTLGAGCASPGCEGGVADGGGGGVASLVWQYKGPGTTQSMGSFRISGDGSRVIGWGQSAGPQRTLTEVDEAGHDLLDFVLTNGDFSYRAIKVPLSAFDLGALRDAAGSP